MPVKWTPTKTDACFTMLQVLRVVWLLYNTWNCEKSECSDRPMISLGFGIIHSNIHIFCSLNSCTCAVITMKLWVFVSSPSWYLTSSPPVAISLETNEIRSDTGCSCTVVVAAESKYKTAIFSWYRYRHPTVVQIIKKWICKHSTWIYYVPNQRSILLRFGSLYYSTMGWAQQPSSRRRFRRARH